MWLTDLKKALVLENIDQIGSLIEHMPTFESLEEMEQAAYLLAQCKVFLEHSKSNTALSMKQIRDSLEFLRSTQSPASSSLNIKF